MSEELTADGMNLLTHQVFSRKIALIEEEKDIGETEETR